VLRAAESSIAGGPQASVALLAVTGVVFMVWFWRSIKNAQVLERILTGRSGAAFSQRVAPAAGWAVGAWLIPVFGLFFPALCLSRVDRISGASGLGARPLIAGWALVWGCACVLFAVIVPPATADLAAYGFAVWRAGVMALLFAASAACDPDDPQHHEAPTSRVRPGIRPEARPRAE